MTRLSAQTNYKKRPLLLTKPPCRQFPAQPQGDFLALDYDGIGMRPGAIYMKTKIKPVNWLAPITPSFNAKLLSCKTLQMNFVLKRQNYLKINILLINIATWCIVFHTMWRAIYEQHRSFGHSIPLPARRCSNCCISLQRETKNFTCERCGSKKSLEQSDRWSDTS